MTKFNLLIDSINSKLPVEYSFNEKAENFCLYSMDLINSESKTQFDLTINHLPEFKCTNNTKDKLVLFGDFGVGSDMPFALSFTNSKKQPEVLLYVWCDNPDNNQWIKIADSFEEFKTKAGM